MLRIARKLHELSFASLMDVYVEGNKENGAEMYAEASESQQLLLAEQDFYNYLTQIFFKTKGAFYAVWDESNVYRAALRIEPYEGGFLLAALETRPEYRQQGYAKKLMNAVLTALQDQEKTCIYSHVNRSNIASLRTHFSCGFEKIKDYAVYADGSVLNSSVTLCRKI